MVWVLLTPAFWEQKLISSVFDGEKDANKEVCKCILYSGTARRKHGCRTLPEDGHSYMQDK